MKKIITLSLFLAFFGMVNAQEAVVEKQEVKVVSPDVLQIKETLFDFGKIPQGKPVYHTFSVTNTGTEPLVLDNVQASCGCTTPEWNHQPIAPGATTDIKVGFNAAGEGPFDKSITITFGNHTQAKQLQIKGLVWKAPEGAAPANASINFLKKQTF
jgi:hypothetical protein